MRTRRARPDRLHGSSPSAQLRWMRTRRARWWAPDRLHGSSPSAQLRCGACVTCSRQKPMRYGGGTAAHYYYTVPLCHFAVARAAPTPTAARDASASSSPLLYLYDASASIVLFCVCLFLWLKRTLVCWSVGQIARPDSGEVRPAPAWYACIFFLRIPMFSTC
jgi:hypothetical protein